jgi:hypothetical protein
MRRKRARAGEVSLARDQVDPEVTPSEVTDDIYGKGVPKNEDGSVAETAEITVEDARDIGAIEPVAAQKNRHAAQAIDAKRKGKGGISWGTNKATEQFALVAAVEPTDGINLKIERVAPGHAEYPKVPMSSFASGDDMYEFILATHHTDSVAATYKVTYRSSNQNRVIAVGTIDMPSTLKGGAMQPPPYPYPYPYPPGYPQQQIGYPPPGYPGAPPPPYGGPPPQAGGYPPPGYPQQQAAYAPQNAYGAQQPYPQQPNAVAPQAHQQPNAVAAPPPPVQEPVQSQYPQQQPYPPPPYMQQQPYPYPYPYPPPAPAVPDPYAAANVDISRSIVGDLRAMLVDKDRQVESLRNDLTAAVQMFQQAALRVQAQQPQYAAYGQPAPPQQQQFAPQAQTYGGLPVPPPAPGTVAQPPPQQQYAPQYAQSYAQQSMQQTDILRQQIQTLQAQIAQMNSGAGHMQGLEQLAGQLEQAKRTFRKLESVFSPPSPETDAAPPLAPPPFQGPTQPFEVTNLGSGPDAPIMSTTKAGDIHWASTIMGNLSKVPAWLEKGVAMTSRMAEDVARARAAAVPAAPALQGHHVIEAQGHSVTQQPVQQQPQYAPPQQHTNGHVAPPPPAPPPQAFGIPGIN